MGGWKQDEKTDIHRVGVIWWCYRTFQYYLNLRFSVIFLMDTRAIRNKRHIHNTTHERTKKTCVFLWRIFSVFVEEIYKTTTLFDAIMQRVVSVFVYVFFHFSFITTTSMGTTTMKKYTPFFSSLGSFLATYI